MLKILIILTYLISYTLSAQNTIPKIEANNWNILQDAPIWIGWTYAENNYWCRSTSIINTQIKNLQILLEDKKNYPNIFDRIEKTTVYDNGNVHIFLDMPFPFAGRDYIVKYTKKEINNKIIYSYQAVKEVKIPIYDNYVRLINAAGEWHIESINDDQSKLTYIWNGELRGDFPDWALTRAWKAQGQEVITWIKNALE